MSNVPAKTEKSKGLPAVNPETLIAQAIEKGLPVETMERLLAMRRELKAEWAREEYYRELSAFQEACPVITKSAGVDFTSKKGVRVKYKYAPLDVIVTAVKKQQKEHGFSYTITTRQDKDSVTAICNVHHVAGHSESTEFTIPVDPDAYMNAAQKVASALTYAKRYAFCNAFGILTGDEDDDGRESGPPREPAPPKPPQEPAPHELDVYYETLARARLDGVIDEETYVSAKAKFDERKNDKRYLERQMQRLAEKREASEELLSANSKGFDDAANDEIAAAAGLDGKGENG